MISLLAAIIYSGGVVSLAGFLIAGVIMAMVLRRWANRHGFLRVVIFNVSAFRRAFALILFGIRNAKILRTYERSCRQTLGLPLQSRRIRHLWLNAARYAS